ncbi:DUF5691 domain-containing protein [Methylomonas rivi]|uniref:DUF5691 domain-containing protein n=1 Tax=Methylomonas rivi TaxID=2952226 RepID=A0ABT1U9V7_9GAMM|nr:DUF5691 domain-containing protein [Methylomonas sp. WSC-6]MCQ8130130.1 DUF5691 domain-containing protein [Methylomonas sp. WSC-6]
MRTSDFDLHDAAGIEAALALGLKKTKLPESGLTEMPQLAAIALAAERRVYADVNVKRDSPLPELQPPQDAGTLLPDPLRRALLRIAGQPPANNSVWEAYCRAIDRHLAGNGYRLHPFDLLHLEKYLSVTTAKPGTYAYWYRQQLSLQPSPTSDEIIDWNNWQQFGKAEQQAFLQQQRITDPQTARQALEKDFAEAPAALRQMYVETLAIGLNPADQAFLESLDKDRSGKVVEIAQRLLARFPDSEAARQNRENLAERLETQFLTRKIGLAKQKGKKASESLEELSALTEFMPATDIAAVLKLAPADLPRKIDQELALPFARSAALAQDYPLALALLQKEDEKMLLSRLPLILTWFKPAPLSDKLQLAETAATWLAGADNLNTLQLLALSEWLAQPLTEKASKTLLNGKAFKNTRLQSGGENPYQAGSAMEALAACALLLPKSLHEPYLNKVQEITFRSGANPLDFLALLDSLK